MAEIFPHRMTAEMDGDFVVFVIGMRVNKPWKIHKWLPVMLAMPRMIKELQRTPDSGLLAVLGFNPLVQYWRSFDDLERYARNQNQEHWPAWVRFNKRIRSASGDVGIYHETYLVKKGAFEAVYRGMPRVGLAVAGRHVEAGLHREAARQRLTGESATA